MTLKLQISNSPENRLAENRLAHSPEHTFAFSRRNCVRAGEAVPPSLREGARECRGAPAPAASCAVWGREHTSVVTTRAGLAGIPARGGLQPYVALSPAADRFFVAVACRVEFPVRLNGIPPSLMPRSGIGTTRLWLSGQRRRLATRVHAGHRPPHQADRSRPPAVTRRRTLPRPPHPVPRM